MVKVALDKTETTEAAKPAKSASVTKKKSRWMLKLMLLLIAAIIAAPSIISTSGQAPMLLQKVHPRLAATMSFQRLNIHWWAPIEVIGLKVRDLSEASDVAAIANSPLLCEVERVSTAEPLWRIVMNAGRGTGVTVKSPRINLIADDRGTNIDRTMASLFGESKSSDRRRFPFRITIEDGEVQLRSSVNTTVTDPTFTGASASDEPAPPKAAAVPPATEVAASVSSINGTFSTMDTERWLPAMKLSASIKSGLNGVAKADAATSRSLPRPTRLAAGLDDVASDFPKVPLETLAGSDESGDSTGARIQIVLTPRADEKGRQTIKIGARDVDLRLLQPFLSMLGQDVSCDGMISGGIDARLAGAELSEGLVGRLILQGERVRVRQLSWASDEWLSLGELDASGAVAFADDGMLIQDLNVKTDIAELTGSGELRHSVGAVGVTSDAAGQQLVQLKGSVDVARVASSLRKTLAIHQDVTIQRGRLTFGLKASAAANQDTAGIPLGTGDAGAIKMVALTQTQSREGKWQLIAKMEELAAVRAGKPLQIDSTMRIDAIGPFSSGLPKLSQARLTAAFGTIDCIPDGEVWKISGVVQPSSLWQQLQQFSDVPEPGLRGDVNFQSRIAMKGETIQLTDVQLNSSDVKASSISLAVTPANPIPSMLDGTIHVEGTGAALRTLMAPFHDASWLAERAQVVCDLTATPKREIQLAVRVSPESVATLQRPNVLSVSKTMGRPVSNKFGTASASSFVIDEADVAMSLIAKDAGRQFDVKNGSIKVPGLAALVNGSVSVPADSVLVDLVADATYDLDILSRRLFTAASAISLSGQGMDKFQLTGSPSALSGIALASTNSRGTNPATIKGSGAVSWSSANFMGLQFGKATIQPALENSLLRSNPIQCSLNGGELNMMPQYDIATSRLQLGTGSRVQNFQLTPELCRTWLGYVAPLLGDSADVSGEVSARVDRFLWDFNGPQNSDVLAQLTIHRVEASPGASLASMLEVIDLLRKKSDSGSAYAARSLTFPQQTIPVQIRQGYVAHDGLLMELAGYQLKTSGGVGLNKQLQLTLDVPLEKSTAAGVGRSVKIPLRGTISQPQPDTSALLQNLGKQQIQEKVTDQVDKALNKNLNKLFDKF